ncbi:tRNA (N6-isopentenyl adenosine(37)-C2)-methylthiotransferase MiaB [Candidatus Parcubacteria bacterium]|nr:tRNA (N6-isopentenyl adenosine(37)-C2)-methylthiotransferase MiaB [Candidatus Parcubacteria bacterium]
MLKYFIKTYGCQMNESDSERMAAVLENIGYKKSDDLKKADLIIFNMCAVRQTAVDRVHGQLKNIGKLKVKNKKLKVFLTGCILDCDKKKLSEKVDLIFDIRDLDKITNYELLKNSKFKNYNYLKITPKYKCEKTAFVPIMTGCDNFCSYCAVPYTRGREYSRPAKDILKEIHGLIKNGCEKITLLGQNVNSYKSEKSEVGSRESEILNFSDLLKLINNIKGEFKIDFLTSHPKDVSNELIKTIAECEKVSKNLHLPFQSGSSAMLKKMNRKYTRQDYLSLVKKIKKATPEIKFSTDIIVGFPGETKKQFEKTVSVVKKINFDLIYVNKYSARKGTAAEKLYKDDISLKEKKSRWRIIDNFNKKKDVDR